MAIVVNQHFDVLNYVKKAKEFGANEQLAEYQARQIEQALLTITQEVKNDIKHELHSDELITKKYLDLVKLELQKEIVQSSNKTIIWIAGLLGTFSVFFLGILAKGFHWL